MLVTVRKTTNWKIFNFIPPITMVYIFNMPFSTFNLWDMEATAAAYSATKNNLLYGMIFVMLLRCDFRKLAKLGARMTAIFLGGSFSMALGFVVAFVLFKGILGVESWRGLAALCASWTGGSANMAAMSPIGKMSGVEDMSNLYLFVVIALLASRAGLNEILAAPMWLVAGGVAMLVHALLMVLFAKMFRWDLTMVSTSSMANVGGPGTGPVVASAHNPAYAGIGVLMAVLGAAIGNIIALGVAGVMQLFI